MNIRDQRNTNLFIVIVIIVTNFALTIFVIVRGAVEVETDMDA